MERNPLHDLTKDELIALVLERQDQLALLVRCNREQAKLIEELSRRLEELEKRNPTPRLDEAYSMKAEEKRQADAEQGGNSGRKKQKSKRRGRINTAEKLAQATMHQDIWPAPHPLKNCRLKYSRPVWRIIDGRAVLVAYHIYAGPDGRVPQIPGVPKRSEFGQEIIVALSWQHYIVGLSLDKAIAEQAFFWGLRLSKSQADSLLNQLAKAWLPEFDALCQLLAVSAVVYADETSWSINSVWTFLSERARLTIFGCHTRRRVFWFLTCSWQISFAPPLINGFPQKKNTSTRLASHVVLWYGCRLCGVWSTNDRSSKWRARQKVFYRIWMRSRKQRWSGPGTA